jgi:hypothetical protein
MPKGGSQVGYALTHDRGLRAILRTGVGVALPQEPGSRSPTVPRSTAEGFIRLGRRARTGDEWWALVGTVRGFDSRRLHLISFG